MDANARFDREAPLQAATCPTARDGDDEVARHWVAGSLPAQQAEEFEAHVRTCTGCQRAVERAAEVTASLRAAAASHHVVRTTIPGWWWAAAAAIVIAAVIAVWMRASG